MVSEYNPDLVSAAIRSELEREGQVYYVSNRVTTIDEAVARVEEAAPEAAERPSAPLAGDAPFDRMVCDVTTFGRNVGDVVAEAIA